MQTCSIWKKKNKMREKNGEECFVERGLRAWTVGSEGDRGSEREKEHESESGRGGSGGGARAFFLRRARKGGDVGAGGSDERVSCRAEVERDRRQSDHADKERWLRR